MPPADNVLQQNTHGNRSIHGSDNMTPEITSNAVEAEPHSSKDTTHDKTPLVSFLQKPHWRLLSIFISTIVAAAAGLLSYFLAATIVGQSFAIVLGVIAGIVNIPVGYFDLLNLFKFIKEFNHLRKKISIRQKVMLALGTFSCLGLSLGLGTLIYMSLSGTFLTPIGAMVAAGFAALLTAANGFRAIAVRIEKSVGQVKSDSTMWKRVKTAVLSVKTYRRHVVPFIIAGLATASTLIAWYTAAAASPLTMIGASVIVGVCALTRFGFAYRSTKSILNFLYDIFTNYTLSKINTKLNERLMFISSPIVRNVVKGILFIVLPVCIILNAIATYYINHVASAGHDRHPLPEAAALVSGAICGNTYREQADNEMQSHTTAKLGYEQMASEDEDEMHEEREQQPSQSNKMWSPHYRNTIHSNSEQSIQNTSTNTNSVKAVILEGALEGARTASHCSLL